MVLPQIHSDPNILNSGRFTEATYLIIHHTNLENHSLISISIHSTINKQFFASSKTMAFLSATHISLGLQTKTPRDEKPKEIWGMPTPWVLPPAWCAGMGFSTLPTSLWCWKHQAKENNPHTHTHLFAAYISCGETHTNKKKGSKSSNIQIFKSGSRLHSMNHPAPKA